MADAPRILVLGGTAEAVGLAEALAGRCRVSYALAGRTRRPSVPAGAELVRGGFGGADGLARWLARAGAAALVDATHPFARNIAASAARAAARTGTPRLKLVRPPWTEAPGDRWRRARDAGDAARLLREAGGGTAFLAVGSGRLATFAGLAGWRLVVRTIEPDAAVPLDGAVHVVGRGPFTVGGESALMERHGVDVLVTRNSGGAATRAKLEAARRRGIPVVMVDRPPPPAGETRDSARAAARWIHDRTGA